MQKECVIYKSKFEKAQEVEAGLDKEIARLNRMIDEYRTAIGGDQALKENTAAVKQQLDIMQRRLVHAQRRKLDAQADLGVAIKQVNSLRRENMHLKRHFD
jgi:chromosome segregation ATPase